MAAYPHKETPLTEHEKTAYRYLLYQAMLDIRMLCQPRLSWDPRAWRWHCQSSKLAGRMADWLHNMAMYAAQDFRGFSADWFWEEYEDKSRRYREFLPDNYLPDYRRRYDEQLARLTAEQNSA